MKESQSNPTKAVLFAYFRHQATPLECQLVETWLKTADGAILYFTYLDEWERQYPQFSPDLEAARERYALYRQQVNQTARPDLAETSAEQATAMSAPILSQARRLWSPVWLVTAASIVLVLSLLGTTDSWFFQSIVNGYRQIQTTKLPDGSSVVLGSHSSLRFARFGFGWGTRRVWLTGEAQFRVTHQPGAQRFVVQTPDQTAIEVLGTVFVVKSRRNTTRVILETGRIRMTTPQSKQPLVLMPGDVVTVSAQGRLHKQHPPQVPTQVVWHDHRFVFQDTPLAEVVTQLYDTFGVAVNIQQDDLKNRTVSGTFQAETADDLLEALTLMMNLRVTQSQAVYTLTH